MIPEWLRSFRTPRPNTAAEIRSKLHALKQLHAVTVQQRDLVALDAVNDEIAATRWSHLDDTLQALIRRMDLLAAALPQAEAKEAEAAREAEAVRRERAMDTYQQHTKDAQRLIDAALANLPDGDTLTALRDVRDRLASEARDLRTWSNDTQVRRPLDPLHEVVSAMQLRIDRVARARWAASHPITLRPPTDEVTEAAARIGRTEA